jgi:hypothetical protein
MKHVLLKNFTLFFSFCCLFFTVSAQKIIKLHPSISYSISLDNVMAYIDPGNKITEQAPEIYGVLRFGKNKCELEIRSKVSDKLLGAKYYLCGSGCFELSNDQSEPGDKIQLERSSPSVKDMVIVSVSKVVDEILVTAVFEQYDNVNKKVLFRFIGFGSSEYPY